MNFLIWTAGSAPTSGGQVVLHKLAYELSKTHKVYTTTPAIFPNSQIEILPQISKLTWDTSKIDFNNTVVIYPEITKGTRLGGKHIVRWILCHTKPVF